MKSQLPNRGDREFKEWLQECAKKWNAMTNEQKKPFVEEQKDSFKEYQIKMSAWEKEMIKLGNLDIVRQDALLDPNDPKNKKEPKKIVEKKTEAKVVKNKQEFGCPNPKNSGISSTQNYINQEISSDKKISDQGGGTGETIIKTQQNVAENIKPNNLEKDFSEKKLDRNENIFGIFKKLFKK